MGAYFGKNSETNVSIIISYLIRKFHSSQLNYSYNSIPLDVVNIIIEYWYIEPIPKECKKIIFYGMNNSGKTTIIKQLKYIHGLINDDSISIYKSKIQNQVINTIKLFSKSYIKYKGNDNNSSLIDKILNVSIYDSFDAFCSFANQLKSSMNDVCNISFCNENGQILQ